MFTTADRINKALNRLLDSQDAFTEQDYLVEVDAANAERDRLRAS